MSLLKHSSAWFLRPPHLKGTLEDNSPIYSNVSPSPRIFASPDEEFYIRKCCPVTLNHLLPDLYLTRKQNIAKSGEDFDANLRTKFEKHLEESHEITRCSSTTDEEEHEDNNSEVCIENDLHALKNGKIKYGSRRLLKPHKINYPDSNMTEWKLPGLTLNNYSTLLRDRSEPQTFPRAKRVPKVSPERFMLRRNQNVQRTVLPCVKDKRIQNLDGNREYNNRSNAKLEVGQNSVNHCNVNDNIVARVRPRINVSSSIENSRPHLEVSKQSSTHPSQHLFHLPQKPDKPSLCVYHRRARSMSPFKKVPAFREKPLPMKEYPENIILPSPHLVQLARLRKQELELEEKLLLRQRQKLEFERLKPPAEKWYEIKDYRFHQEAHKNNAYLKNEGILPLIHERRRELYEALTKDR